MKIHLYFAGKDTVPFEVFREVIEEVRKIVAEIERSEVARIRHDIPELPAKSVKDALGLFDQKGADTKLLRVSAVKPGSLELVVVLTAFGYWLLQQTVGDSLTEAWRETEMNEKMKKFFLAGKRQKLEAIEREVNKSNVINMADAKRRLETESVEVPWYARLDREREEIHIRINPPPEEAEVGDQPPTWEDLA
jgi:hypothetical protein